MEKIFISTIIASMIAFIANTQNVTIPDSNFKAFLISNIGINTNSDTEIQESEAQAFTQWMIVNNQNIADLTGIEAFINITGLVCNNNQLTSLDISNNSDLQYLNCSENQLTSLILNNNTVLTELYCDNNQLTSLDISNSNALTQLYCGNNQLMSLDVSDKIALIGLGFVDNQLTEIDVSNNTALSVLICDSNQLSELNVSNNLSLYGLNCMNNLLTDLDVSNNSALQYLNCSENQLASLNIANGNNVNFIIIDTENNINLSCIQVDNAAYSNANWTGNGFHFDAGVSFNESCLTTGVNDVTLIDFTSVYPNPATNLLNIEVKEATTIEVVNVVGVTITAHKLNGGNNVINVSNLTNGVYYISNETGGITKFSKE